LIPETVKLLAALVAPAAVLANDVKDVVLTVTIGVIKVETVLLGILKLIDAAPELVICKLPLYVPALAVEGILTYKVGKDMVPDVPTVNGEAFVPTLLEKFDTVDTSKPEGGVTVIPLVIFVPETLILCAVDAVPTFAAKAAKEPVVEITGYVMIICPLKPAPPTFEAPVAPLPPPPTWVAALPIVAVVLNPLAPEPPSVKAEPAVTPTALFPLLKLPALDPPPPLALEVLPLV
jgi:hypothetical protein